MTLQRFKAWLDDATEKLRAVAPAWPPLIGFEEIGTALDEQERRWLDEEERILPYLYWPNI